MLDAAAAEAGIDRVGARWPLDGDLDAVLDPGAIVETRGTRGGADAGRRRGDGGRVRGGAPSASATASGRGGRAGSTAEHDGAVRRTSPATGNSTDEDGGPMDIRDQHPDLATWNALIERSLADPDSEPIENLGPMRTRSSTTRSSSAAARAGGSARRTCARWAVAP